MFHQTANGMLLDLELEVGGGDDDGGGDVEAHQRLRLRVPRDLRRHHYVRDLKSSV